MPPEGDLTSHVMQKLVAAKVASMVLAELTTQAKNDALMQMAHALRAASADILSANEADVFAARAAGQSEAKVERLMLNPARLGQMAEGLQAVAMLTDPVGETIETIHPANGLRIAKVRVPLGVIAMIYESRPNVTADAAGLCLKTGNAVVLRGGREALQTNQAIVQAVHAGLRRSDVPVEAVALIEMADRAAVDILIGAHGLVDLAIPRGGAALIQRIVANAKVPVVETGVGNCHVYADEAADLAKATRIILNAKAQRPSVCNAAETLLVHEAIAADWLPQLAAEFGRLKVALHLCPRASDILDHASDRYQGIRADLCSSATDDDWNTEFLAPILAVKVVTSLDDAMEHIHRYGTHHSEVIVTESGAAAERFLAAVDAAVVYHNASSRFTDGYEFGFGTEIGISTQKLHARGPMGLRELTSYKYLVRGDGQIRA